MQKATSLGKHKRLNKRNYLLINFLYSTGIRVAEASNLKIQHMRDWNNGVGYVRNGKGGKDRRFDIS